jgi:hypothetical protein
MATDLAAASPMQYVGSTQNGNVLAGMLVNTSDTIQISANLVPASGGVTQLASTTTSFSRAVAAVTAGGGSQQATWNGQRVSVALTDPATLTVTDVSDPGPSTAVIATSNEASSQGVASSSKHVRKFVRATEDQNGNGARDDDPDGPAIKQKGKPNLKKLWVLSEDSISTDDQTTERVLHHAQVMTYTHVKWFRNAARDAERHAARPTTEWIPLPPEALVPGTGASFDRGMNSASAYGMEDGPNANLRPAPSTPKFLVSCDSLCTTGSVSAPPPLPIGTDPGCAATVKATPNANGTVNLLYQHGYFSDAITWCDMDPFLRTKFLVRNELRYSLSSTKEISYQANELKSNIGTDSTSRHGPYVFIGHSMGGLISRSVAQDLEGELSCPWLRERDCVRQHTA